MRLKNWTATSLFALSIGIVAPAAAQEAAPSEPATTGAAEAEAQAADAEAPGEIIVTAQKREQRLQDVPLAVSVVSGEAIEAQGRTSLESVQFLVPALTFQKSGTTLNQSLFLRGVGTATFSIAGEPSVSTVLDGVVLSRSGEAFSDLVDIERVEVLRGPQGTLFGKNASAGVINIVSRRPGNDLGGFAEASYFTGDEYRLRGAVDVPFSPQVRSRFTGFYGSYDGNIRNVAPNVDRKVNGYERYGIRGMVVADATETLTFTLIGDYRKANDDCCAQVIGTLPNNQAAGALPTPRGDKTRRVAQDLITRTKEEVYGISLQADLELGDHTVTSITAYRNYKNREIRDGDFLPRAFIGLSQLHDDGPQTGDTLSQEFRLTSPAGQMLEYVLGAYYSRAESERTFTRTAILCTALTPPAPALTPCTSPLAAPSTFPTGTANFGSTFKNLAFFGQGTLNLSEQLRLIAGLRYTIDELDVFHQRVAKNLNTNAAGQPVGTGGTNPSFGPFRGEAEEENLSGKVGVQFDIVPESTAYATYSRGYKGPAFNVFYNLGATGTNVIDPETSDSYEVGLKNSLFGGRLVLNLAGFYAKYKNFQANNPDIIPGTPPTVVTRFTNAGVVSTRGVELDMLWSPVRDLSFSGGLAYTDAHVNRFKLPPGGNPADVIPPGTSLQFAPKWKGSLAADYRVRTGGPVDVMLGAQGSFQSKQLSIFSPSATIRNQGTIDGYGLVNLSAGVSDPDDRYRLTFHVRNLFDQSFAAQLETGGPGGSIRYQIPRDADRYYGITGRLNF